MDGCRTQSFYYSSRIPVHLTPFGAQAEHAVAQPNKEKSHAEVPRLKPKPEKLKPETQH